MSSSIYESKRRNFRVPMLFLRFDQAKQLLRAAVTLREKLVIRYFLLNGLAPMELSLARIEYLDPVECTLFLPKRHWKRNCIAHIDSETVKLQIVYSEDRREGPLIRGRYENKQPDRSTFNNIVKRIAERTNIIGKKAICPIVLKRTFGKEWLKSGGNVGSLQKAFSHKHLWSTAHYLRFFMDDVKEDHTRLLRRIEGIEQKPIVEVK